MSSSTDKLPPNVQLCLPSSHAVLPGGFTRGTLDSFYTTPSEEGKPIFPLASTAPFVVHHPSFLKVLGDSPKLEIIAKDPKGDGEKFAHEAGVWIEETKEVVFTSNLYKDPNPRNQISKIRLDAVEQGREITSSWDNITPTPDVLTGNGATLYGKDVLVCAQGLGTSVPSSLSVMSPIAPYKSYPIINNFYGRPFNSVNDVVVLPAPSLDPSVPHPTTDRSDLHHLPYTTIWFTDPTYGHAQGYKPSPMLPNQVYCFTPSTGDIRVVADGISMPNGLCFDLEGEKCYITDTGCITGDGAGNWNIDSAKGGAIYVYDVIRPPHDADLTAHGPTLANKRVFAYTDGGAPDGIKTDRDGNVYSGCVDGVQVWNKHGTLIGRIVLFPDAKDDNKGRGCANFNFCPDGKMFILAEDRIYVASLNPDTKGSLLLKPNSDGAKL
ncbi:calcium-dependent phosphotriesterase [Meredithblackwellia eburnea MCA 4105]